MGESIDDPWAADAAVTDKTDVDLEANRVKDTRVSDPDRQLHRAVGTLAKQTGLTSSEAADRSLRVEVAAAIDERSTTFSRSDYDVAYTIPPTGWVSQKSFETVELVDEQSVPDSRTIHVSTPPVVYEMAAQAVDDGLYVSVSDMVCHGAERLLGQD